MSAELGGVDFCWRASAADPFHGPLLQTGSQGTDFDGGVLDVTDAGEGSGDDDGAVEADAAMHDAASDASVLLDASDAASNTEAGGGDGAIGDAEADAAGDADGTSLGPDDAGPPPLTYLSVSNDLSIGTTGTVDIIAVEPGSGCAAPLVLGTVTLDATLRTTLVLAGGSEADAAGALGVSAYADEIASSDATRGAVRVVNAALSPYAGPIALSFEAAGVDVPIATNVQPRAAGTAASSTSGTPGTPGTSGTPAIDALGYTLVAALGSAPSFRIVAMANGVAATTSAIAAPPAAGSVHTAFVTRDATSFVVLWCDDILSPSAATIR